MTDKTHQAARRTAFEASFTTRFAGSCVERGENDQYRDPTTQEFWEIWCDALDWKDRPAVPAAPTGTVDTPTFRELLGRYADACKNWQQEDDWMPALADLLTHLDGHLAAAVGAAVETPPDGQAVLGERITNETFQWLCSLNTFMNVSMQLLPTVSWRDAALASNKKLKALLERNFGVQLTPEEDQRIGWSARHRKVVAPGALKLPAAPTHAGVPQGVVLGFNAYLRQVAALPTVPTCGAELPPALLGFDNVNLYYITGFNDCHREVLKLNGLSEPDGLTT
jgi:hypothetical protein